MNTFRTLGEALKQISTTSSGDPSEPVHYDCDACQDRGYVYVEGRVTPCDCQRKRLLARKLLAANIPAKYKHATLSTFETTPKTEPLVRKLCDLVKHYDPADPERNRGFILMGHNGVGKTHLALGVLRALVERGYTGTFYNVVNLLDEFKAEYARRQPSSQLTEKLLARDVLVLDDLGVQRATDWSAERLHAIINRRYELGRTLLVTTNKSPNGLRKMLDNAVISRLYEMCQWYEIFGEDYRSGYAKKINQEARSEMLKTARPEQGSQT